MLLFIARVHFCALKFSHTQNLLGIRAHFFETFGETQNYGICLTRKFIPTVHESFQKTHDVPPPENVFLSKQQGRSCGHRRTRRVSEFLIQGPVSF